MEEIENIMQICQQALEENGYEIYGYSDTYGKFTVRTGLEDIVVDFQED